MASITVALGSKTIQNLQLEKDLIFIGRHDEAEICLDNPLVSRRHAMIYKERGIWAVEDLSGKNGVFVNGAQVIKQHLNNNDVIEIGKYALTFLQTKNDAERERDILLNKPGARYRKSYDDILSEVSCEKPTVETPLATSNVDMSQETLGLTPKELAAVRQEMGKRRRPHLQALTQMERKVYPIEKKSMTMGRSSEADIRLGGLAIGAVQAVISEDGGAYYIQSTGGLTSVKVNGDKVAKDRRALRDGDEIEIGSTRLRFVAGKAS